VASHTEINLLVTFGGRGAEEGAVLLNMNHEKRMRKCRTECF